MANIGGWPMCRDGDVLIHLSPTEAMKLHSEQLSRHSKLFKDYFQANAGALLTPIAKRAGEPRWRFDVIKANGSGQLEPVVRKYYCRTHNF
jgi:hypothetical protein